jgi:hypothetical protein
MSNERNDNQRDRGETSPFRINEELPLLSNVNSDSVSVATEELIEERQEIVEIAESQVGSARKSRKNSTNRVTPGTGQPDGENLTPLREINQNDDSEDEYSDEVTTINYDPADDSENDQSEEKVTTRYSENVISLLIPVSLAMLIVIWAVQVLSPVLTASGVPVTRYI